MRPCVYCYDSTHSSLYLFFFYRSGAPRDLHSFPTRRSSDLGQDAAVAEHARAALEPALKPADDLSARQSIDGRLERIVHAPVLHARLPQGRSDLALPVLGAPVDMVERDAPRRSEHDVLDVERR